MSNDTDEKAENLELVPLYAYEEVPPRVKTKEELLAENLALLKQFDFPPPDQPENDSTGRLAFLHACKKIDKVSFMKFPVESIGNDLMKLDSDILDLSFAGLGMKGCIALAAALRVNTSVNSLILVGNYITPEGGMALAKAVLEARSVNALDLSVNQLGAIDVNSSSAGLRGGHVVNELLASTSPISSLSLRENGLTDGDITLFSEVLADNVMLIELDLSYNKIGYLGAVELGRVIARNGDIHNINLEWNRIPTTGSLQILSEGFLHNNTIKTFNLSACGLDDTCAQLLNKIMSENAIEEIIIAHNRLTAAGGESLAKGIVGASSLTKLVVDGNPLMDTGCQAILNAVATMGDDSSFHFLSLLHCGCSTSVVKTGLAQSNDNVMIMISEGSCKVGHNLD